MGASTHRSCHFSGITPCLCSRLFQLLCSQHVLAQLRPPPLLGLLLVLASSQVLDLVHSQRRVVLVVQEVACGCRVGASTHRGCNGLGWRPHAACLAGHRRAVGLQEAGQIPRHTSRGATPAGRNGRRRREETALAQRRASGSGTSAGPRARAAVHVRRGKRDGAGGHASVAPCQACEGHEWGAFRG